ncbi:hypothetical protein DV738_g5311, partial [Chaetothyriales sp. CBS 135597]
MRYTTSSADLDAPFALSTIVPSLQLSINHLGNVTSTTLDHYFPPEKRQASRKWVTDLATERPYFVSFLLAQFVLSGPPLALFIITAATLVASFILGGIVVAILGALLLTLFVVGIGIAFLLPVLFFTTVAALSVWLWGGIIFYIVRHLNNREGPTIPTDFAGGLARVSSSSRVASININGEGASTAKPKNAAQNIRAVGSSDHSKKLTGNFAGSENGEAKMITSTVVDEVRV